MKIVDAVHIRNLLAQKFQVLVFHEDPEVRQIALDIWEILYPKKKGTQLE